MYRINDNQIPQEKMGDLSRADIEKYQLEKIPEKDNELLTDSSFDNASLRSPRESVGKQVNYNLESINSNKSL